MQAHGQTDLERALIESLRDLANSSPNGELAVALLKGKEEGLLYCSPVPDLEGRLAESERSLTVQVDRPVWGSASRKRPDIAIYDSGRCVVLVEAKQAYAAEMIDAKRPNTNLRGEVQSDIDKLRAEHGRRSGRLATRSCFLSTTAGFPCLAGTCRTTARGARG